MANNQLYTTAAVYFNDNLLSEAMSVSINFQGNHQRVKTLAKGFAGMSQGAPTTEITVSNQVPAVGFEVDVTPIINNLEEVQLTIFTASSTFTVKGFLESGSFEKAVDSEGKISFQFVGGPSVFE